MVTTEYDNNLIKKFGKIREDIAFKIMLNVDLITYSAKLVALIDYSSR